MDHLPNLKEYINRIYQISRRNNNNIFPSIKFSSSGKILLYSDYQQNIRMNHINVTKAEYNWKENQADRKDIKILGKKFVENNNKK